VLSLKQTILNPLGFPLGDLALNVLRAPEAYRNFLF
jgi:hypothetical protein